MALASMTLLTHGSSLLWALLCVWHTGGRGGSLLRALLCGVRGGKTAHRREKKGAHDFQHDSWELLSLGWHFATSSSPFS